MGSVQIPIFFNVAGALCLLLRTQLSPILGITRWGVLCIDMVSYDPRTRTVYASDAANPLALLDAVLHIEHSRNRPNFAGIGGARPKTASEALELDICADQ